MKNRIGRLAFGANQSQNLHPQVPDLTDSTLGVIHIGTDIVVHWIDDAAIHRVSFNSIFGAVTTWNSTTRRES